MGTYEEVENWMRLLSVNSYTRGGQAESLQNTRLKGFLSLYFGLKVYLLTTKSPDAIEWEVIVAVRFQECRLLSWVL